MNPKKINKEIRKSRERLRNIYGLYLEELQGTMLKIDKMLEILEGEKDGE
jgi:hypothetical protein